MKVVRGFIAAFCFILIIISIIETKKIRKQYEQYKSEVLSSNCEHDWKVINWDSHDLQDSYLIYCPKCNNDIKVYEKEWKKLQADMKNNLE